MRILKSFLMVIIVLLAINVNSVTASTFNEIEFDYCSEDVIYMTLEIPALDFIRDIELPQNTFDAPVTIRVIDEEGVIAEVEIDGNTARITGDGINARITGDGINARIGEQENGLIRSYGINARITGDGINARITGDGINARVVTVRQLGVTIFSETL